MPIPDTTRVTPDLTGFGAAMDQKRASLGSIITFFWPTMYTWGDEIPLNPVTQLPLDPTASAMAGTQASASATCSVFFKAINRGGASNADVAQPIGRDEKTRVFVNVASGDAIAAGLAAECATEFEFHGNRFQVYAHKWDEIVYGYKRFLIYAAEEGNDE